MPQYNIGRAADIFMSDADLNYRPEGGDLGRRDLECVVDDPLDTLDSVRLLAPFKAPYQVE